MYTTAATPQLNPLCQTDRKNLRKRKILWGNNYKRQTKKQALMPAFLFVCRGIGIFYLLTMFLKSCPAVNFTALLALILITAPVCGLRPFRAFLVLTEKVPKPIRRTSLLFLTPLFIPFKTAFTAASPQAFDTLHYFATTSTNSCLFIQQPPFKK